MGLGSGEGPQQILVGEGGKTKSSPWNGRMGTKTILTAGGYVGLVKFQRSKESLNKKDSN